MACRSKKALRAAEQDRPDVAARRKLWRAAQPFIDPESLVFLDETDVNTKMARLYGWSPVGERCRDSAPFGHWKTMTFVAGLRLTGLTAPWVLDGPMDGDAFRTYVRHVLAPTLTRIDMRALAGFGDPETVELKGAGAFVFRYGAVVLVGATPTEEALILTKIAPHAVDPPATPEIETARIELRDDGEETVSADGRIRLREATPERLLLAATVLARSVVLARDEMRIEDAFDRIEPLLTDMREHGRAHLPIRQIMRQIGNVLSAQHRVVGRARIGEKPDLLWEHPELDRLYGRLEAEYELGDRTRTIERKLEMLGDSAEWLLDLVQDKRSLRLELSVIGLIAFEVVIGLYEIASRWPH